MISTVGPATFHTAHNPPVLESAIFIFTTEKDLLAYFSFSLPDLNKFHLGQVKSLR